MLHLLHYVVNLMVMMTQNSSGKVLNFMMDSRWFHIGYYLFSSSLIIMTNYIIIMHAIVCLLLIIMIIILSGFTHIGYATVYFAILYL